MLEALLTAEWPSRSKRLALSPLHARSLAWSTTGLIAFTSVDPATMPTESHGNFSIHVMSASRPGDVAVIRTDHKSPITFLEWCGSGRALLSVDECGECRLWEMKGHMSNEWTCMYSLGLGGSTCVAVQWLATADEASVRDGAGSAYDSKYPRTRPPGPLATAATLACVFITADGSLHVLYQDPSDRSFAHASAPVWLASGTLTAAAIGLYADGDALVACTHEGSERFVSVNEVQIALSNGQCRISVRGLAAIASSDAELLCFDSSTRDLFTYSAGLLQRFHPRVTTVTANSEIFGPNSETLRKSEYHAKSQIECAGNVCAMSMSPSGAYLALLRADGVCELFSSQTMERLATTTATATVEAALWWSMAFSPNSACLALLNAHGDVSILDCMAVSRDEAEAFAFGFELSMVRRCDWGDLVLCLHARANDALCQRVVQQLEQRFQEQKPPQQQLYLRSYLSLLTTLYRLQRNACSMIDCNIRLLLETCVSAFRACASPPAPQAPFSPARLRSSLEDDVPLDDILAKMHIAEKKLEGLQPLGQWGVNCAVFLLKNIDHLVACYPSLKLTRQTLPLFTAKASIPGVAMLFDVSVLSKLRELLLYALYVRGHRDDAKLRRKSSHIALLLKMLGELRAGLSFNVFDPINSQGPIVACHKLQEIFAKFPAWEASFRHSSYEPQTLLARLNVLPDRPAHHGALLPGGRVVLRTEDGLRGNGGIVQYDVIRHVPLTPGARARQCVRCLRATQDPRAGVESSGATWTRKWASACVCGGLWRSVPIV